MEDGKKPPPDPLDPGNLRLEVSRHAVQRAIRDLDDAALRHVSAEVYMRRFLGRQFRYARRIRRMTQAQFARAFDLSLATVGRIEAGEIGTLNDLLDLAKKLGLTVSVRLLGYDQFIEQLHDDRWGRQVSSRPKVYDRRAMREMLMTRTRLAKLWNGMLEDVDG